MNGDIYNKKYHLFKDFQGLGTLEFTLGEETQNSKVILAKCGQEEVNTLSKVTTPLKKFKTQLFFISFLHQ